jgi:hypothetical protein
MPEIFDQENWKPGDYFEQDKTYIGSNGEPMEMDYMHPVHARHALKKYRRMFPEHVKHINRTQLGKRLRRLYVYGYIIHERGSRV